MKTSTKHMFMLTLITLLLLTAFIGTQPASGTLSSEIDVYPSDAYEASILNNHSRIIRQFQPRMDENTLSKILYANYNHAVENGVSPNDTFIIMLIESGGDPKAVSPAGAKGLYGVMPFHYSKAEAVHIYKPAMNAKKGLGFYGRLKTTYGKEGALKRYLCGENAPGCINGKNGRDYYAKYLEYKKTFFDDGV